jgi:hypothetical protein
MSDVYLKTIALLEQEIEAIDRRRGELVQVIASLRPLAGDTRGTRGRSKKAQKRNERTNERTNEQSAGQRQRDGASLT